MNPLKLALVLSAVDRITEPVRGATKSVAGFKKEVQETVQAAQRMSDVGRNMEAMGRSSMILGGALTYANEKILKNFSDLEDAQASAKNAYSTVAGLDKGFASINRQVVDAGNKFPGTTAEFMNMAAAMKKMGMATGTIESGAFKGAAALKVMFDLNPAQAGEQFVQMARAMGVAGKDSLSFADTLQRVSYASGLSLAEISDAMQYMGAPLKALHMAGGLDDAKMILATMGVLKQAGLQGSMIGTSISQALEHLALIKPTLQHARGALKGEAAAALDRAGIGRAGLQFFDEQGMSLGVKNLLTQIDRIKSIKSDADRSLIGKELFGVEGARLVEQVDLKAYSEVARKMLQQESIATRLDRITETLGNRWKAAAGTLRNVAAIAGEQTAPALYKVLDKANGLLTSLSGLIERHPMLTKALGLSSLSLGAFFLASGAAFWSMGKLVTGVSEVIITYKKLGAIIGNVQMWAKAARSVRAFTLATWLNVRSLWAQVAASRAGQAVGGWVRGQIAMVKALTTATWGAVSAAWGQVTAFARLAATSVAGWFMPVVRGVQALTASTWSSVTALWAQAVAFAASPVGWVVIGVVALATAGILLWKNWAKVTAFFKGAWAWFESAWSKMPGWVKWMFPIIQIPLLIIQRWSKIQGFLGSLGGWFAKTFPGITGMVKGAFGALSSAVHDLWASIGPLFSSVGRAVRQMASLFWDNLRSLGAAVWKLLSPLVDAFRSLWALVGPILSILGATAKLVFRVLWEALKALGGAIWKVIAPIIGALRAIWKVLQPFVGPVLLAGLKGLAIAAFIPLGIAIGIVVGGLWLLVKVITLVLKFITMLVVGITGVITLVQTWSKTMWKAGGGLIDAFAGGIKAAVNKPVEAIKGVLAKVRRFLPFSPAKEGPLSDIHRLRFIETIAENMKPDAVLEKIRTTAALASKAFRPMAAAALAVPLAIGGAALASSRPGAGGGNGSGLTIQVIQQITFPAGTSPMDRNAFLAMMRECAADAAKALEGELQRNARRFL